MVCIAERPASHVDAAIVDETRHSRQVISTMSLRRNTASIGFPQTGQFGNRGSAKAITFQNCERAH